MPALFARRLGDTVGRQRVMADEGHLLLILHSPPDGVENTRAGRLFWRDPTGEWRSKALGDGPQALKRHVGEFVAAVEEIEKHWQSAAAAVDYYRLLREIAPLHRAVRNLHATLQQTRELAPNDRDLINLRDQVGEIERTLELLHGDVRNGLDFTVAHQAEQQTERSYEMAVAAHRLNLLAAVFLPIATLAAVFGMNLSHGLGEEASAGLFWTLPLAGLAAGFMIAVLIARKPALPKAKPPVKRRPAREKTMKRI